MDSILEITDTAYCLKLSKEDFDLSFVRRLLKSVAINRAVYQGAEEEDINSRGYDHGYEQNFDHLMDK